MKRLAVDIGGTFTDIVYIDDDTMQIVVDKVRTTPEDPGHGVLEAIKKIKVDMAKIAIFIHGTTVSLNTLVQRKGAKVGLITTHGFTDVLEMARADRKELYNFLWKKPKPLAPRRLRLGVSERTDYLGQIVKELSEEEVEEAVRKLREKGVEAIAVCLLHSYTNPENEQKIGKILTRIWPEVTVSLSHQIAREFREYERTSTTVIDAYIKKSVVVYLERLSKNLKDMRFAGQLLVASPSGVLGIGAVKEKAIATLNSGPIGGAAGAAYLAKLLGVKDLVTMDVGGTSFDVSVIKDGMNIERYESELMGYPVLIPGVDMRSIGAGGGSIARVDPGGMLVVGPESAGAEPGPMCYGLGGREPTVTDAALVNGLIDPDYFVGGEIPLDIDLAKKGVGDVSRKLGLSLNEAADGILAVARDSMTTATREILIGQGYDPRDFVIMAYGGAGGLFATSIARDMGISRVIIPTSPGVFSAWGMLTTNLVNSYAQTHFRSMNTLNIRELENIYQDMENSGLEMLREENIPENAVEFIRSLDMCYEGQGHYVEVPLSNRELGDDAKTEISNAFHRFHEIKYGHQLDAPPRVTNVRLKAIGKIKDIQISEVKQGKEVPPSALKPKRKAYLGRDFVECQIYDRYKLLYGNVIDGPAIIEEPLHTTVVMPEQTLNVDRFGNLIISTGGK
jgi:N-methylhydantoinase A